MFVPVNVVNLQCAPHLSNALASVVDTELKMLLARLFEGIQC